jgi:SAM-dependent methyltransferase
VFEPGASVTTGEWESSVIAHYEQALWGGNPLQVRDSTGGNLPFDVARWMREPDAADETLLARCTGPTLDVGCGPGRLIAALAARGVPSLGVDVAAAAVAIARSCGALALQRSVFDRVPGAGRWTIALLADGNIGIGGDAAGLLARLRELLAPGGTALIEVDDSDRVEHFTATVTGGRGDTVATFPWARIGADPLVDLAGPLGYRELERWSADGRCFVALHRC